MPICWVPFALPDNYDNYTLQLHAIHERPVVDYGEDISLKPLPPLKMIPHHKYYSAPILAIVGVIITMIAILVCIRQRKFCFNKQTLGKAMQLVIAEPKEDLKEDPVPTQSKRLLSKEALSWPKLITEGVRVDIKMQVRLTRCLKKKWFSSKIKV